MGKKLGEKTARWMVSAGVALALSAAPSSIACAKQAGDASDTGASATICASAIKKIGDYIMKAPELAAYGPLQKASYSNSGNSLGNTYRVEASRADDGSVMVEVWESPQHDIPCAIRVYRAPDELLDQISAIVDKVGMKTWGELPLSEFIAYDAPTTSLSLTYDRADPNERFPLWLSTSFTYELPEGGTDAVFEIRDLMLACATDASFVREYTETLQGN